MNLRNLKASDAPLMLEWMHDTTVVEKLQTNFASKTIDDCYAFIKNSITDSDINLAIADDNDEYMGTVSLKHMDSSSAEFAITIRKCAMKKGISIWAMNEIIALAKNKYQIKDIYWCVSPENLRAVRFYDKNGFSRVDISTIKANLHYTPEQINYYIWYKC